ncbi:excinuclease ABC subunit C [Halobacteriales archaeon QS_9_68_42]|nr:MAG: excinuclease ABC subunit C [Halobacteriales archaeon QS_9_68_42]
MDAEAVRARAGELPREPGVYQFEADEEVVYVGKAVDLRERVRSYTDPRSERVRRMVKAADAVDFAVTDTETQALLLEANLIKRHQPRYNVRLKDDKSYPLVQLTDHEFPRIEVTRDPEAGATAFGPYTDKGRADTVVKALRSVYGVRGCSDHKYADRERPCLDYEMGLCTAPCTDEIGRESYLEDVESVVRFLEGETGALAEPLRRQMEAAAEKQAFERAAALRDRLDAVEAFHEGGGEAVVDRAEETVDVLGVAIEGDAATVARLHSEDGKLVDRERHRVDVEAAVAASGPASGDPGAASSEADRREDSETASGDPGTVSGEVDRREASEEASTEAVPAVLSAFIPQFYADRSLPNALLLPERHGDEELARWLEAEGVAVRVPGAGREAKLVELALKNARRRGGRDDGTAALARRLGIDRPERVEGVDVSHAQGKAVVGSDVTFVGGSPEKRDYRRRKLTEKNDDYANMRELVRWRAERAVEGRDDRPDPDLLLVDGGEGQLGAARDALAETEWDVPVVALAKAEELVVAPDRVHDWDGDDPALHLLQRVRDEAHRFAVQYHGTVRDEVSTPLDEVSGVGPELRKRLLRRFGSVDGVRSATREELAAVEGVGGATAAAIDRAL